MYDENPHQFLDKKGVNSPNIGGSALQQAIMDQEAGRNEAQSHMVGKEDPNDKVLNSSMFSGWNVNFQVGNGHFDGRYRKDGVYNQKNGSSKQIHPKHVPNFVPLKVSSKF